MNTDKDKDSVAQKQMLDLLNRATLEAIRLMRFPTPKATYPNGCPILSEGPQRDDL